MASKDQPAVKVVAASPVIKAIAGERGRAGRRAAAGVAGGCAR